MEPSPSEEEKRDTQLETIFRTHVADLYRYIYQQVHHASTAEDLTSDIFLKALRWLQLDRSSESVKGWLYATARSLIADYWREQGQMDLLPLETAKELLLHSAENDSQRGLLQARIQHLLDGLSSRDRDILTLRYFRSYSTTEIGQILGISANYVRVLQLRALRRAALLEARERNIPMESPILPYNEQTLRVLELTEEESNAFNHNYIGTEHLLLGILHESSAAAELIKHGITLEGMRGGIAFIIGRPTWHPPTQMGFTPRTKEVLALAAKEAQLAGDMQISPHHLLIAILREGDGIAAQLLQVSGVRLEQTGGKASISIIPDEEGPITLPTDLQEALAQHPDVCNLFKKLSNSKQKGFVDRIERVKGETARSQQIAKTIQQLQLILKSHQTRQQ